MDQDENLDSGACRCCCGMVIVFVVLPLLIIPCSVIYGELGSSRTYSLYPGQTRITSLSSTACQGVSISTDQTSAAVYSYLLLSPPPLGATNTILLAVQADVSPNDFKYWMFHFYRGSTYSMAACLTQGNSLDYFVKGNQDFNDWYNQHRQDDGPNFRSFSDLQLLNRCGTSDSTDSLSFSSEDDYYFAVYNSGGSTASVQIWFSFNLTEYSTPEYSSIISSCTATGATSCSLDIPYKSDYLVLLKTDLPLDGRWDVPMKVTTSCVIRGWVYAVIEVCMVITSILVLLPCCCIEILNGVRFCIRTAICPCRRRRASTNITSTAYKSSASSSTNVTVRDPNLIAFLLQSRETTIESSPLESKAALTTPPRTASSPPPSYAQALQVPPPPQSGYYYAPPAFKGDTPLSF